MPEPTVRKRPLSPTNRAFSSLSVRALPVPETKKIKMIRANKTRRKKIKTMRQRVQLNKRKRKITVERMAI